MSYAPAVRPSLRRLPAVAGLALVALLTLLTALLSAVVPASVAEAAAGSSTGWLRVAHLVPGFGAARIDLQAAGGGATTMVQMSPNASYGDVTRYRQFPARAYVVTVRPVGAASDSQPLLSRTFEVAPDKAYTLAVLGTEKAPRLAALTDDLTPPVTGHARVRVLPAANQAPTVSVSAVGGPTLVDGAVLGQASGYTAVPSGSWQLKVTNGSTPVTDSTVKLSGGDVYTLLVLDGSTKPRLDLITDAAGTTSAPKGGAATGAGGAATQFVGTPRALPLGGRSLGALAAGIVLVIGFGVPVLRRRSLRLGRR